MDEFTLGATIAFLSSIGTLIVSQILGYYLSIRLKQKEDAKNFRLISINKMKNELGEIKSFLTQYLLKDHFPDKAKIIEIHLKLYKLKSDFHTFSETKDLAEAIDKLYIEIKDFELAKIAENSDYLKLFSKLIEQIDLLSETSLDI